MSIFVDVFLCLPAKIEYGDWIMIEFRRDAVSAVIRKIRLDKNLSQEVVSGLAGIARSHLAMIETGAKLPNFETIWAIANAFEIKPHVLVALIEQEAAKIEQERK